MPARPQGICRRRLHKAVSPGQRRVVCVDNGEGQGAVSAPLGSRIYCDNARQKLPNGDPLTYDSHKCQMTIEPGLFGRAWAL